MTTQLVEVRAAEMSGKSRVWYWALALIALVIGVGARLYLAYAFYGNFDQASYDLVAKIMLNGGNVYAETDRYNYSPVWSFILLGLAHVALRLGTELHVLVRGFLTLVDVLCAVCLGLIVAPIGKLKGVLAFAVYLLNPVAILLVGYHGQFENLALLPLLVATAIVSRRSGPTPVALVWALGTLSLVIKHLSVFSVWMLFVYVYDGKRRLVAMALSVLVFLLSFLPYVQHGWSGIVQNVLFYSSEVGFYGTGQLFLLETKVLPHVPVLASHANFIEESTFQLTRLLLFVVMLTLPFVAKSKLKLPLSGGMALSGVALLALIYGISEQYFIVPVILGGTALSVPYFIYSTVTTVSLVASPTNVYLLHSLDVQLFHLPLLIFIWNVTWLASAIWMIYLLFKGMPRAYGRLKSDDERT